MVRESSGASSGTNRVGKNMQISEGTGLDEIHRGGVVVLAFAWEAGDDVGADGGVRQLFADEIDAARVVFGAIPAMHGGKNSVGRGLQRHVEMIRKARRRCKKRDHIASNVERFDRAQAQASDLRFIEDLPQQLEQ